MMKKQLPGIYTGSANKHFTNCQSVYYGAQGSNTPIDVVSTTIQKEQVVRNTVPQKIRGIFASPNYIYKADVEMVTDAGVLRKRIIGQHRDHLITMDNELIPISTIKDIYTI